MKAILGVIVYASLTCGAAQTALIPVRSPYAEPLLDRVLPLEIHSQELLPSEPAPLLLEFLDPELQNF